METNNKKMSAKSVARRLNIESQISIAQLNKQKTVTLAIPNSAGHKNLNYEEILDIIISCLEYEPEVKHVQIVDTVGSNSITLWTLQL